MRFFSYAKMIFLRRPETSWQTVKSLLTLRSNSLRSTERKLFYPSIPVNNQADKRYGRIRKRIQAV